MKDLYCFDSVIKMPLMTLPVRTTFARTQSGGILLSPGSQLDLDKIVAALGDASLVTDLVAPSLFHCGGMEKAIARFPSARVWGPAGVRALRPKINWTHELTPESWLYSSELPMIVLEGMPKVKESVFYHQASRSLIVSDLVFNLVDASGLGARLILGFFGTYRKFGVSRFFLKFLQDNEAFLKSLEALFSFDFENIIVGHGSNVMGDAKVRLADAFRERGIDLES